MNPSSIALSLSVLFLAGNSALGQYIVTVDYVLRRSSMHDSASRREKVASISFLAIPGQRFDAKVVNDKAVNGKETFQVRGTVKPVADGHVKLDVDPIWTKDGPVGRTRKAVSIGLPFDPMFTHAEKPDAAAQNAADIERQRIRLEDADTSGDDDGVWFRWLGDTLVIGGLVQYRVSGSKREQVRSYYYFRLKEAPK